MQTSRADRTLISDELNYSVDLARHNPEDFARSVLRFVERNEDAVSIRLSKSKSGDYLVVVADYTPNTPTIREPWNGPGFD